MSEIFKIVLTAVTGVLVFVVGQLVAKFFIDPIYEQAKAIGGVAYSLIFYANVYANPGQAPTEVADKASEILRQHASELMAKTHAVPWYSLWEFIQIIPQQGHVKQASNELIGLSNSLYQERDHEFNRLRRTKIIKLLRLKIDG